MDLFMSMNKDDMNRPDPSDFDSLLVRCADKAYHFALRLTGNDQDAQDLVQEALTRAFQHRDRYDPRRPLGAWVNRILHNVFLDAVRRYEHRHKVSLDSPPPTESETSWENILPGTDENPTDALIKSEEERILQEALNKLPLHYRSAIVMSDIEGMTYEEIARITGVPVGTVCSRLHQGRILLRRLLETPKKLGAQR
jgi:RNA polymerase sigma-70 factor (ECF subfamily)